METTDFDYEGIESAAAFPYHGITLGEAQGFVHDGYLVVLDADRRQAIVGTEEQVDDYFEEEIDNLIELQIDADIETRVSGGEER